MVGPLIGAQILSTGLKPERVFGFIAFCPLVLAACAFGIAMVVRKERNSPTPIAAVQPAAAE
ncbi:MAG: hypothetical protein WDN45_03995 [Caulobacteraceae bacterium]